LLKIKMGAKIWAKIGREIGRENTSNE